MQHHGLMRKQYFQFEFEPLQHVNAIMQFNAIDSVKIIGAQEIV